MGLKRVQMAHSLMFGGGAVLCVGIFLLIVQLVMLIAWAAPVIALIGFLMLLVGLIPHAILGNDDENKN